MKKAIVERHAQDCGSNYTPEECLVTVGGKQAVFEAIVSTVQKGDEVILPVPYWVSYLDIIRYAGGNAVLLETREEDDFAVRATDIERLITLIESAGVDEEAKIRFREGPAACSPRAA